MAGWLDRRPSLMPGTAGSAVKPPALAPKTPKTPKTPFALDASSLVESSLGRSAASAYSGATSVSSASSASVDAAPRPFGCLEELFLGGNLLAFPIGADCTNADELDQLAELYQASETLMRFKK